MIKKATGSEKPNFSDFEDWRKPDTNPLWFIGKELSNEEKKIVERNIELLLDRGEWHKKVEAFEAELNKIKDKEEREKKRAEFCIHFDFYEFKEGESADFNNYYFPCSTYFNRVNFGEGDVSFEGAIFGDGNVSFRGAIFGKGNVNFGGAIFGEGNVSFMEAIFGEGNVGFVEAIFGEGDVSFEGAQFGDGNVNFWIAIFGEGDVGFEGAKFGKGNVNFGGAQFGDGNVNFWRAKFGEGNVNFWRAQFGKGDVGFWQARFGGGNVDFGKAQFGEGNVSFWRTQFGEGNMNFGGTQFGKGDVNFGEAQFGKGDVSFEKTKFGKGHVYFTGTVFNSGYITFSKAQFGGQIRFTIDKQQSKIKNISFNDIKVAGNLRIDSDFKNVATFQRLDVKGSADFSGCTFEKVPDFRDMKLDRPPEVAGMQVPPEKLEMGFNPFAKYFGDDDDVVKYRKLKSMAIAASDHVKSGEFFAYEMMAKRGVETTNKFALFVDYLYGLLSGYGQSYMRPLISLSILWALFTYSNMMIVFRTLDFLSGSFFAARLSLHNLVPFISSLSRFVPTPENYTSGFQETLNRLANDGVNIGWLTLLGTVEQLIGAILLFLLLLGLRNKFRLK